MNSYQLLACGPRLALLAIPFFILPGACNRSTASYHETLYVFGTLVDIDLPDGLNERSRKALAAIRADFTSLHRHLHAWKPGELVQLNQALSQGRAMTVTPPLLEMTRRAKQISLRSNGFFNPAIGALIGLWGFHTDTYPITGPIPSPNEVKKLVATHPSMRNIRISGRRIASDNPQVQLDFGGIAKGFALDRAVQILRSKQIKNAMVNAGGDLRAIGNNRGTPWRVGIRNPFVNGIEFGLVLGTDESVMTSGNYFRYHMLGKQRFAHIINPYTGYPVAEIVSATVITDGNATLADAAATALIVAGSTRWREVMRNLGLDRVMLIDANGNVLASNRMFHRLLRGEKLMETTVPGSGSAEK